MKKLLLAIVILLFATAALAEKQEWVQPGTKTVAITKSDSTEHSPPLTAVYIGGAGDVRVIATNDKTTYDCSDAPIFVMAAGSLLRVRTWKVCDTGTDATAMVGLTFER